MKGAVSRPDRRPGADGRSRRRPDRKENDAVAAARGESTGSRSESRGEGEPMVMGRNPVRELLRAGRSVSRLWVQEGAAEGSLREILGIAQERRIPVSLVPRARLDVMAGPVSHQGVMAAVSVKATLQMDDLESLIRRAAAPPIVFLLDGVKDPQNLGAIIRVANATGALAVIIPERGAVGLTPVVAKASAGAIEYVPVVKVANLSQAVQTLKTWGVFVYAAHPAAATRYTEIDWRGPVGLVIGGEGEGVRPLVRKRCDDSVFLPMAGAVASLNAATAAAVLGFEVVRQRTGSASLQA